MKKTDFAKANSAVGRPQRIVLAVTVDNEGAPDIIPLGWKMMTSFDPPMYAISIGHTRYSCELVRQCREFVLAWPSEEMAEEVLFCGMHSGRKVDKFKDTGLTALDSSEVKPPLIGEAVANMECRLAGELISGDHTIFVGEIVASHISDTPRKLLISVGEEKGYRYVGGNNRYRFGVIAD